MPQSLVSSLTAMFDKAHARRMSGATGVPEEQILHGFRAAAATILGGIAGKTGELQQLYTLVVSESGRPLTAPDEDRLQTWPGSQLIDKGQQLLSILYGENRSAVVEQIARQNSLQSEVMDQLMDLAAPLVSSDLGNRVYDQGISLASFPALLRREISNFSHGPQSVSGTMRPAGQRWMWAAVIAALLLGIGWMRARSPNADEVAGAAQTAHASRARMMWPGLGRLVDRELPGDVRLSIPENGMEAKLLSYIEDPARRFGAEQWFDFDRLTFEMNSAIPRPESEDQLANIASILKAYPRVRLKIRGYTDSKGNRQANQRLSENRAASVHRELVGMGVASGRLEAEGYGDQHPIADNATEQGRAINRRISLKVLQK